MVKLPNSGDAVVDVRKLRDYCLSPRHPRGRHKARVFVSALGLTANDAEEAVPAENDEYGERYMLDFEMETEAGIATVRSGWTVRRKEDFPRLTSCWVL